MIQALRVISIWSHQRSWWYIECPHKSSDSKYSMILFFINWDNDRKGISKRTTYILQRSCLYEIEDKTTMEWEYCDYDDFLLFYSWLSPQYRSWCLKLVSSLIIKSSKYINHHRVLETLDNELNWLHTLCIASLSW